MAMNKNCSSCGHHEVCIARHKAGHNNACYTDCGGYCTEFFDTGKLVNISKVEEAISIMKKAYDEYRGLARKNLEADNSVLYWHWQDIAEGTRRSWDLLEELFDLKEEDEDKDKDIECDGRCLNCNNYGTSACQDNK